MIIAFSRGRIIYLVNGIVCFTKQAALEAMDGSR